MGAWKRRLRFLLAIEQIQSSSAQKKFALMRNGADMHDPRVQQVEAETFASVTELTELLASIEQANEPTVVAATVGDALALVMQRHYTDRDQALPASRPTRIRLSQDSARIALR